ncbi:acyl-CoA carboxylase subunit beta [Streptomyces montanus]|uniref:Acyl-CoA carboxylase subunit beta n=2 Tax=Streptomyces montanus TaxID=2580423 RepID=A0A5R9FMC0_9ACTN|nr:acyl-CoA carboxylase subunit beta [Streptomyces montanus]TLS45042.1 acyl-CoA carboxylase subunit beta [Streptomyces montanus]
MTTAHHTTTPHAGSAPSARERVEQLLDEGSFVELEELLGQRPSDGPEGVRMTGSDVVSGYGTVDGRPVAAFATCVPGFGTPLSDVHRRKIVSALDFALKTGCPVIGIHDCGNRRVQGPTGAIGSYGGCYGGSYGEVFRRQARASGVIPQISLVLGACVGSAAHSPALGDFTVMVDQMSHMLTTATDVIEAVTGDGTGIEELGGARAHNTVSGNAHHLAYDAGDAVEYVRALLSYLPSNNHEQPPAAPDEADLDPCAGEPLLDTVVPETAHQPYDMHEVVEAVLDDGELLETQTLFAPNIITGFGSVEGHPVGIVANQPLHLAGCLDIDATEKAARFIRTCDAFNLPVLTFVDVPGFLPGIDQEYRGISRHCAQLIYAYAEATVPLITVITRQAHGGTYDVMGSKQLGADLSFAWPTARIGTTGARDADNVLLTSRDAAEQGWVDGVIRPSRTRHHIVRGLRALRSKRLTQPPKKHGNIPL